MIFYLIFIFLILVANLTFPKTGYDKSSIKIKFQNSGWNGINGGWEEDEWIISPSHILDYDLHKTNRNTPGVPEQYIIPPEFEENYCEMTNNQFSLKTNDMVCPNKASDGTSAELRGAWLTWDTNYIYLAVLADMKNGWGTGQSSQGVNLLVLFDIVPGGYVDFPNQATWNKKIYTRDFDCDFYWGCWGPDNQRPTLGGHQYRVVKDSTKNKTDNEISATEAKDAFYNGEYEDDINKRVMFIKLRISDFLSKIENKSNLKLKVIFITVDGASSDSGKAYDLMPDNLAGMSRDNNSIADNHFEFDFTDENGNIKIGVRPRYDGRVKYLPGSRRFNPPIVTYKSIIKNILNNTSFERKAFIPEKNENLTLSISLPKNTLLIQNSIRIYNLRGELVRVLTQNENWVSTSIEYNGNYTWDGKDDYGEYVKMGSYILIFQGTMEDGMIWKERQLVTVIR